MTTFDLVATLQYRENYGAHNWDGTGECPQYWKNKGGTEQVIATGLTVAEVTELGSEGLRQLVAEKVTEEDNDYVQTYLLDWELVSIDSELRARVAECKDEWADDDYDYIGVAVHLGITEHAAKAALAQLREAA